MYCGTLPWLDIRLQGVKLIVDNQQGISNEVMTWSSKVCQTSNLLQLVDRMTNLFVYILFMYIWNIPSRHASCSLCGLNIL
jgi:hypothetical protein